MDLTVTQTIHNFTNINYVIPHAGGSFPSVIDRFIKSYPAIDASSKAIYKTRFVFPLIVFNVLFLNGFFRFWWDSAGPTYFAQVKGLLGYDIPTSQLLFGTVSYPLVFLSTFIY